MIYSVKEYIFILLINFTFNFPTLSYWIILERDYIIIVLKLELSGSDALLVKHGMEKSVKQIVGLILRKQEALKKQMSNLVMDGDCQQNRTWRYCLSKMWER